MWETLTSDLPFPLGAEFSQCSHLALDKFPLDRFYLIVVGD